MWPESTEAKYDRLRARIQNLVLTAYPNPERNGCLDAAAMEDMARRAATPEAIERDPQYEHITHCSPCYAEFLAARDQLRSAKPTSGKMPRSVKQNLRGTLNDLEHLLDSVAGEVKRSRRK